MALRLKRSTRRLLVLLAVLPTAVLLFGILYTLGMTYLEGAPRQLWEGLEWASETLSTTGYGKDAHWNHPAMVLFVMLVQFTGMFLVFLVFPIYVVPFFEERFEARLPRRLPTMDGRVLFNRYGPAVESLVDELRRAGTPFVILEQDPVIARRLIDQGYPVVVGTLDDAPGLLSGVEHARALFTNADDHEDATFIMTAREQGFTGPIYALAANPLHRPPMLKVGATAVYTPSYVLAAALAAHASARISPSVEGLQILDEQVGLAEYRVHPESPLAGQRLGDLQLRERLGVNLIGQWQEGCFVPTRGPDCSVLPGAILVAIGSQESLVELETLAAPIPRTGPIVVAGFGEVGRKVDQMLTDAGETTVIIDLRAQPGVDVVGNLLEESTLERGGVGAAGTVVLALSDDSAGVFATAVIREYSPQTRLIARVNRAINVHRFYQAGADFALSVGQVAGQLMAHHLFGESALLVDQRLQCMRMTPGTLVGMHPWRAAERERSGASLVGLIRDGKVLVKFPSDLRIEPMDLIIVCGTGASIDEFARVFRTTPGKGAPRQ